jgi:hypothetical protein
LINCGAYNLLAGIVEILRPIAIWRRHSCKAAATCASTGLLMKGSEPPQTDACECFLTQEVAYAVLDVGGQLEVLLDKADRLAQMLERNSGLQQH